MAEYRNCFWSIVSLCLLSQAAKNDALTTYLNNICINGAQIHYPLYVRSGIQVMYSSTPVYTNFMDCRIIFNYAKEWSGLFWRALVLDSVNRKTPDCQRSFIEVSAPKYSSYKFCGNLRDMPTYHQKIEFLNVPVTIRFFINFTVPVTTSTQLTTTAITTPVSSTSVVSITPFVLPIVKIIFDFTTFSYCKSIDSQTTMCRQSRRCLDKSLRCNKQYNCVSPSFWNDLSDEVQCQEPPPPDFSPIWISLGVLAFCLAAYWCLYKPGYLFWRLARFRNARCCGRYICSRCCFGGNQSSSINCCTASHGQSVSPIIQPDTPGPSVKFSKTHQGDIHIIDDIKDFNSKMTPVNWMAIKYDDGNHQRELR